MPVSAYHPTHELSLCLLPLRFERITCDRYVVANLVGDMIFMSRDELERLVALDIAPGDGLYERAFANHFVARSTHQGELQLLGLRLRSRMAFLREPTALHIFVVTLRCEHSCPYCQVSRRSADKNLFDMSHETAMQALEIVFASPPKALKLEFQGGEPLLNFDLIKAIVFAAEEMAPKRGKVVEFVIATNLALLSEEILTFCQKHNVLLSTSLDGPATLHNRNRPRPGGNSYQLAVQGIRRAQEVLGRDRVGALMTTTEASLDCPEDIIDEYLRLDLDGIFLRPLSPYGFAVKTRWIKAYDASRWSVFYERGLRYILEINKTGQHFPELYASLLVQRILTDKPIGYVDLRSPSGAGLGALIYNYDGKVFASDEGRMLAEMGDKTFELGTVSTGTYRSLLMADTLVETISESLTQCAPMCSNCAFEANCGADPVYHHATQQDAVGIKPLSEFCSRQKSTLTLLVDLLENSPEDAAIFRRWAHA